MISPQDDSDAAQRRAAVAVELEQARDSWRRGDTAAWEQHLRNAVELDPVPENYLQLISALQSMPGRGQDCEAVWRELVTLFPDAHAVMVAWAKQLISSGSFTAAHQVLERALKAAPADPAPYYWLGVCLEQTGESEAAIEYYRLAVELDYAAKHVEAYARLTGQLSGAEAQDAVWAKQLAAHKDDAELFYLHSVYIAGDGLQQASADLEHSVALNPGEPKYVLSLVQVKSRLGEHQAAAGLARNLVQLEPSAAHYEILAIELLSCGQPDNGQAGCDLALAACAEGLAAFADSPQLHSLKYYILIHMEKYEEAYDYAIAAGVTYLDSRLLSAAGRDAYIRRDTGHAGEIYLAFEQALPDRALQDTSYLAWKLDSTDAGVLAQAIAAYNTESQQDVYRLAVTALAGASPQSEKPDAVFEQLIARDPRNVDLFERHALRYFYAGRVKEALAVVRRGINDADGELRLRWLEAVCTAYLSGPAEAGQLIGVIRADPQAAAWEYASLLGFLPPKTDIALILELGREGRKRWPQDGDIPYKLAERCIRCGAYEEALAALQSPALAKSHEEDLPLLIGKTYVFLGNYPKALAYLEQASKVWRLDNAVRPLQARVFYFSGDLNAARKALQSGLEGGPGSTPLNTWRGLIQLEAGEIEAARHSFAAVRSVPDAPAADLAWCALGEARLSLLLGDRQQAAARLSEAIGYGVKDNILASEIELTRKELQK